MTQQPSTSQRPVALASFFLVISLGAFGGSFYLLDGVNFVRDMFASASRAPMSVPATATAEPRGLALPAGMTEEFALRLWQEQVDSQSLINRLVNGEIQSLRIKSVDKDGDVATLHCSVRHTEGGSIPGVIVLKRFDGNWFVAYASAERDGAVAAPNTALPRIEDVDVPLLNTMIAENVKSQDVLVEYVDGIVKEVFIESITPGPKTRTFEIEMDETHGQGFANLVAIEREYKGQSMWFLASFTKTGHYPPEL